MREDGGIGGYARNGIVPDEPGEAAVGQHFAANVVEPDTLTQSVQLHERIRSHGIHLQC
jgi:hypothetical protein